MRSRRSNPIFLIALLSFIPLFLFLFLLPACQKNIPTCPATTTPTGTPTPSITFTPTPTGTCVSYSDTYSSSASLANYDYFLNSSQTSTTAVGADYQVISGFLEVAPTNTSNNGGLAIVDNSVLSNSLSNYTVEADFEMDSYATNLGLFGIAFRTGSNGSFYCFQWNGDAGTNSWQIEKNTGSPSVSFSYPGTNVTTPAYTLGTTVHLKAVVSGNNFLCYVNFYDGNGDHQIFNATDSSSPYTSGGVGVRTYGIASPNIARISNFTATACH